MPKFIFEGELRYNGRVIIEAKDAVEALKYANNGQFDEVIDIDPEASNMVFTWDGQPGQPDEVEK